MPFIFTMERTPEGIKEQFLHEARMVWDSPLINQIQLNVVFDNTKSMAVSTRGKPRAIGRSLYQLPKNWTLHIGKKAMGYSDDRFIRTLRHEAIHLGHFRHTDDFFKIARETNAVLTGANEKGFGYQVQVQTSKGSRFRTIKKFQDESEAGRYMHSLADNYRNSGKRFTAMRVMM